MSHPFVRMPTLKELKEILKDQYGVRVEKLNGSLIKKTKEGEEKHNPEQFVRKIKNKTLYAHIPLYMNDKYVFSPEILSSICRKLEINENDFWSALH